MTKPTNEVTNRYKRKTYKRCIVELHKEYDADILARLEKEKSKQGFFKTAAREKIQREAEGDGASDS